MAVRISALKVVDRLETGIGLGESHFREFKSALDSSTDPPRNRDPKSVCKDIGETLVAFANADGGELFVGVEDDGSVTGVHFKDPQFSMLSEAFRTHVHSETPLPIPTVARVSHNGKTVLYFQIPKSTERVHLTSDGRCLQRFDRENRPVPAEQIQYSRLEKASREYDRAFIDGAGLADLELDIISEVSRRIAGGQSPEKCLQFMDLGEYGSDGLQLRRAALLLFAKDITKWHPRSEVRIVRVAGTTLGVGKDYNVSSRDDQTVRGNVLAILENAWETLRPYLTQTKFVESGIFKETLVYPEDACREALVNAVAHRDYSIEGKGVEIFIYDDRLEVKSPGGLLSSISISDLKAGKRTHQSRNAYMARVLRDLGHMREMGEGMLRIYSTMRDRDLVPPEIETDATKFDLVLHHRSVFSAKDQEWLHAYSQYNLSRDEQRTILLGKDGNLLSTNAIVKALGIVDTDQFRKLVELLRRKGILYTAMEKPKQLHAMRKAGTMREVPRFSIRPPDQTEQYRQELLAALATIGPRASYGSVEFKALMAAVSSSSPYREMISESLKLLALVDERMKPLPLLEKLWDAAPSLAKRADGASLSNMSDRQKRNTAPTPAAIDAAAPPARRSTDTPVSGAQSPRQQKHVNPTQAPLAAVMPRLTGTVSFVKYFEEYGFIKGPDGDHYFRRSDLLDSEAWPFLRPKATVSFELGTVMLPGKRPPAKRIDIIRHTS